MRATRPPDCSDCAIALYADAGLTAGAAVPHVRPPALLAREAVLLSSATNVATTGTFSLGGIFWIAVLVVVPIAAALLLALTLCINVPESVEAGITSSGPPPENAEEHSWTPSPSNTKAQHGAAKWVGASGVVASRARMLLDDSAESSVASLSMSVLGGPDGPLCPAMVVAGGSASLIITSPALITPGPQCIVASVSSMETGSSGPSSAVARLFFSETGRKGGILLEAGHQFPIAYIDSGTLAGHSNGIRIHRVCDRSMYPFCVVSAVGHAGHFVVSPADAAGSVNSPVLHLQVPVVTPGASDMRVANVTNSEGQLLASMERPAPRAGEQAVKYYVHFGLAQTDGALILLALVAAMKLGSA